ncbi:MAG: MFS transporter [Desulfurococcaceae archaeon]
MCSLRRGLVVCLLVLSLMWLYADQNLVAPMLSTLRNEGMIVGSEEDWYYYAGLVGTIPVLTGIATTFIWGYLADKLSRRSLFALTVLVGEIPCFLTGFTKNYYELLFLRALTGIGINGAAPVARALVADLYRPEERGRGYAIYNFSSGFGVLLGMLMAGVVLSANLSWRVPFLVAATPNFILTPLFLLFVKEVKLGYAEPEVRKLYEMGVEYRFRINLKEFTGALLSTPTLIFIYLQGVPGTFPWGAIPYWAPMFFHEVWGLSEGTATLIVFTAGMGMMIGYFIGGLLTDRLQRRVLNARLMVPFTGILLGTLTMIALLKYPYPHGDESFAALLPVLLLGLFGMIFVTFAAPNVPAVLSEVSLPEHRGTVFGIFNITDNIGSAFGPTIASGFMVYFLGMGVGEPVNMLYGLIAVSLFWVPCALLWLPAFRTYERDKARLRKILAERSRGQLPAMP